MVVLNTPRLSLQLFINGKERNRLQARFQGLKRPIDGRVRVLNRFFEASYAPIKHNASIAP